MSCFVAFHYRSYGTFFLQQNRLHNIHRGFTHYKYYRAENMILSEKITWDFFNQENSSHENFFLDIFSENDKIVPMETYLVPRRTKCDS